MNPAYASLSRRMWAATIDSVLLALLVAPFLDMAMDAALGAPPAPTMDIITFQQRLSEQTGLGGRLALFWQASGADISRIAANFAAQSVLFGGVVGLCWLRWSATPGKMLLKIKIVDAGSGAAISKRQIVLRLLGYVVSMPLLFAGFFWIRFDRRRQGWHDKIANTVVVHQPRRMAGSGIVTL